MAIFRASPLGPKEIEVSDRVDDLWKELKFALAREAHPWGGFLRRSAFARGIRGSNSIEGYNVSVEDALAAIAGDAPTEAAARDWNAILGYQWRTVMSTMNHPGRARDISNPTA